MGQYMDFINEGLEQEREPVVMGEEAAEAVATVLINEFENEHRRAVDELWNFFNTLEQYRRHHARMISFSALAKMELKQNPNANILELAYDALFPILPVKKVEVQEAKGNG